MLLLLVLPILVGRGREIIITTAALEATQQQIIIIIRVSVTTAGAVVRGRTWLWIESLRRSKQKKRNKKNEEKQKKKGKTLL